MSWDELDSEPSDLREVSQQREDLSRLCLRVFSTEDGQKLLEWMSSMYVEVPIAVPGSDPSYAFYAEGQRNVVRDLMARINQARKL